jgi:molybdenum cofactor sulfurtransferase
MSTDSVPLEWRAAARVDPKNSPEEFFELERNSQGNFSSIKCIYEDEEEKKEDDYAVEEAAAAVAGEFCKMVHRQPWTIKTFFEFYDRVLGVKIFEHFGQVLSKTAREDLSYYRKTAITDPLHVLEVAAGTGRITAHLFDQLVETDNFCKLTATDMSAAAIETAREVLKDTVTQNPNVQLMADVDMADMPFAENTIDAIVCGFGLMYPKDKAAVARQFHQVLRPGGRIFSTGFYSNIWFELVQEEAEQNFGQKSKLLAGALQLTNPEFLVNIFKEEGLTSEVEILSHDFVVTRDETKELLINACVLLEEFNQQSPFEQETLLDQMTNSIHGNEDQKMVAVKVWMLRCTKEEKREKPTKVTQAKASLNLDDFKSFVAADSQTKESVCNNQKQRFLLDHSAAYDDAAVTAFRDKEFARLDRNGEIYLDYVGGSLPPLSLLKQQFAYLESGIVGNPHSAGKEAMHSLDRLKIMMKRLFNCDDSDDYDMVFTANASGAITIVAECFPFKVGSSFVLTKDNHTSVNSIRDFANDKGASTTYVTATNENLIWEKSMNRALDDVDKTKPNLLAYPAQSNATGARHDLKWVEFAQKKGFQVLLDVAAYVPTSRMDLSVSSSCRPDFLSMSFYKMFGYPTGIGCLLAKRSSLTKLVPTGLKSGSVCYYSGPWSPTERVLRYEDDRKFENGTPNYMAFDHVSEGIEFMLNIGLDTILGRSYALTRWLEASLTSLCHANNSHLVLVYPPDPELKGATIMFNLFDDSNSMIPFVVVNNVAAKYGIRLRSGCFCNSGIVGHATYAEAGAEHCELDKKGDKIDSCAQFQDDILFPGYCGAIRLSFGIGSNFNDAYSFYLFARAFVNAEVSAMYDEL